jgi:hypothetical protein
MLAYYVTGTAYQQLSQYKCTLAVETLHKLPPSQFSTGWVQHQVLTTPLMYYTVIYIVRSMSVCVVSQHIGAICLVTNERE